MSELGGYKKDDSTVEVRIDPSRAKPPAFVSFA